MASGTTAPPPPASLPRIVAASLIGTTIEWYDTTHSIGARTCGLSMIPAPQSQHGTSTGFVAC